MRLILWRNDSHSARECARFYSASGINSNMYNLRSNWAAHNVAEKVLRTLAK